jgi:hypothetical protein
MENKDSKSKKRQYIEDAIKAAAHPVRATIIKALHESEKATTDLESLTGESRHNLYYHLSALEKENIIEWKMRDNKKIYNIPTRPILAVVLLPSDKIKEKPKDFDILIDALSALDGQEIPYRDKIVKAEICLNYSWADED